HRGSLAQASEFNRRLTRDGPQVCRREDAGRWHSVDQHALSGAGNEAREFDSVGGRTAPARVDSPGACRESERRDSPRRIAARQDSVARLLVNAERAWAVRTRRPRGPRRSCGAWGPHCTGSTRGARNSAWPLFAVSSVSAVETIDTIDTIDTVPAVASIRSVGSRGALCPGISHECGRAADRVRHKVAPEGEDEGSGKHGND